MDAPSSSGRKRLASLPTATIPSKKALKEANVLLISDSEAGEPSSSSAPAHASKGYNLPSEEQQRECSEEPDYVDEGGQLKTILDAFQEDMKKVFQAKRKRLRMSTAASVNAVNQKIENIWKNQEKQRQKLCQQFSQDFLALFQEWTINAQKTKEEEEKLANLIVKQQKIFQESKAIQKRRLKQAHALYEEYLKNVDDLDDAQEYYFTDQHGAFQKEMDAFKEKILTECQKQDLAVVQASLQSILF